MTPNKQNHTDEVLLSAQLGNTDSLERIINEYRPTVEIISMKYISSPLDKDDLVQEGLIGLLAAIKTYKSGKASFKTYADTCIEHSIKSALRKFARKKEVPISNTVPYEDEYVKELGNAISAEDSYLAQESVSLYTEVIEEELSHFEYQVLRFHIVGCSYIEIATKLNKSPKAIDNALQRIRGKLNRFLLE